MINIKFLTKIIKNNPIIKYTPFYSFSNSQQRDKKTLNNIHDKYNNSKSSSFHIEQSQDSKKNVQLKQQQNINKHGFFKKNKKQKVSTQQNASNIKSEKFLGFESSKLKQTLQNCKVKQMVQLLKQSSHQELAKQLELFIENPTTIEALINLLLQISLKIDLSNFFYAVNEILRFFIRETTKKISLNETSIEVPKCSKFALKYEQTILEIITQEKFSFSLLINFYTTYVLNKTSNDYVKNAIFKHLLCEMAKSDLSQKQNFEALKQYLLKAEDQKFNNKLKKEFDQILAGQLLFFEPQVLKKILTIIFHSKTSFYFFTYQMTNILEVMCLYCQDIVCSSSINEVIQIILCLSKMKNKSLVVNQKNIELENLYFKTTLTHHLKTQNLKLNSLSRFICLFADNVQIPQNQQPRLAQLILTYFFKEIILVKDKISVVGTVFTKINETLKSIISKNLFSYNICKKQYNKFFENINPLIASFIQIPEVGQYIYIKNNISELNQFEQFKKIERSKRGNPKKIYSMLQKAIQKEDLKWIEEILFIMFQLNSHYSHINNLQIKDNLVENTAIFNGALNLLYQKYDLKIIRKIFYKALLSKEKELIKIKFNLKTLITWQPERNQIIWQIFYASWLEAFLNQSQISIELCIIFSDIMLWKFIRFPNQLGHLKNPLFYQILTTFKKISRSNIQIQKFDLSFYRLLCKIITRQHHYFLLDSYLVPFLKDFEIKYELLNQGLKNTLQSLIILYKIKSLVTKQQIANIYQKVVLTQKFFTQREKNLISYIYSNLMNQNVELPPIQQRIMSLIALNDVAKQKKMEIELSQQDSISIKRNIITNLSNKELISLLLSPLFQFDLIKSAWQVLLPRNDLDFVTLDWKTLIEYYSSKQVFSTHVINTIECNHNQQLQYNHNEGFPAYHVLNLTKKVIKYYQKKIELLINQDLKSINKVSKIFKSQISSTLVDNFFRNAIQNLMQKNKNQQKLDEILVLSFQLQLELNQQIASSIMQMKMKKRGNYIYLFMLERILKEQDYIKLLRNYFSRKLKNDAHFLPFQVELYFKNNYPSCVEPYLKKLSNLSNTRQQFFFESYKIKNILKMIQRKYQNIKINHTYNFIVQGNQILLFTNTLFEHVYPQIFDLLSPLIAETNKKSIKTFLVGDNYFDIDILEKKYSWNKKSVKLNQGEQQNETSIKDLQLQMKLAQNMVNFEIQKQSYEKKYKKIFKTKNESQQI